MAAACGIHGLVCCKGKVAGYECQCQTGLVGTGKGACLKKFWALIWIQPGYTLSQLPEFLINLNIK